MIVQKISGVCIKETSGRGPRVSQGYEKKICNQLGVQFQQMADSYIASKVYGLVPPEAATSRSNLAEGGGARWFSSPFYLLTGRMCVQYFFHFDKS